MTFPNVSMQRKWFQSLSPEEPSSFIIFLIVSEIKFPMWFLSFLKFPMWFFGNQARPTPTVVPYFALTGGAFFLASNSHWKV